MLHRLRAGVAFASRVINLCIGGKWPETLCCRVARKYGPDCRFCRAIAAILREPFHCRDEMRIDDVVAWLRRKAR